MFISLDTPYVLLPRCMITLKQMRRLKPNVTNVILALSFIFWPIISGIILFYLQSLLIFKDGCCHSVSTSSWLGMITNVMWLRILFAFILPAMLLVIARRLSNKKSKLKTILILVYLACTVWLTTLFFPYSFMKTKIVSPPPQTFKMSYRYKITSLTDSSETELRFKSDAKQEEVFNYYYKLLNDNGLCLGAQDLLPERRCFPRDKINLEDKMWEINTIKPGKKRKAGGLNWGFVHYLGNTDEGYTLIRISLNNYSK